MESLDETLNDVKIEIEETMDQLEDALQESAFEMLSHLLPAIEFVEDQPETTDYFVSSNEIESTLDLMEMSLCRRNANSVILTGEPGVGKTSLVKEFFSRIKHKNRSRLYGHRLLWLDCSNIGLEDSRACLETILGCIKPGEPTVLCLDGIASLIKRPSNGTNMPLIRATLNRQNLLVIGIMSDQQHAELLSGDADLPQYFSTVKLEEMDEETTIGVLEEEVGHSERTQGVKIEKTIPQATVTLSSNFMLSERQPNKSLTVLRSTIDDVLFRADDQMDHPPEITKEDLLTTISRITQIPRATLLGSCEYSNFADLLGAEIFGQPNAVEIVGNELQLVKSGLTKPGKPASVLLFAGLTGVGKTELAKKVAEIYSPSRRLKTYTMGNYTEAHSVSGIIGVPPGYVGHENGGQLINDLIADPYSVFLLDEAEKAHPDVWKPFLNLFDEGWIVDQRGVRAYGDRAIFILTTNAGENTIQQMVKADKPRAEIEERVRHAISKYRHERSSQPVFSPQLLSRLQRTITFYPLSKEAMTEIAGVQLAESASQWRSRHNIGLGFEPGVQQFVGELGFERNTRTNGKEGGRVIRTLVSDEIDLKLQMLFQDGSVKPDSKVRCAMDGDKVKFDTQVGK